MPRQKAATPDDLLQLRRRLEQWRSTHRPRSRLPEPLWRSAVQAAQAHGLYRTARALGLDYGSLKKRLHGPPRREPDAGAAFLEWIAPAAGHSSSGCVVELESAQGSKMRIEMKAAAAAELAGVIRAFLGS